MKFLKYLIWFIAPSILYAGTYYEPVPSVYPPQGFYAGITGGGNFLSGGFDEYPEMLLVFGGTTVTNVELRPHPSLNNRNVMFGGLIGYNFVLTDRITLGIEGRVFYQKEAEAIRSTVHEVNSNFILNSSSMIDQKWPVDILLKPGLALSENSSLYVVAGIESQKFNGMSKVTYAQTIQIDTNFPNFFGTATALDSKRKVAPIIGIGMQQALSPHFSLRMEYDYVNFSRVLRSNAAIAPTSVDISALAPAIVGSAVSTSFLAKVINDRFLVTFIYSFA